ncbi:MAG: winged helix-turn-helix transcriptional regulator [Clostridia bacterium]|nr:winged helix-turn-helix transcriptional regulator [Clostridia bacterium]
MTEKLRVLMYSERTVEENSICWILRNKYNVIYFASNFDMAETILLTIPLNLVFIDESCIPHYEKIINILYQRHLLAHIMIIPLSTDEFSKRSREIRAPDQSELLGLKKTEEMKKKEKKAGIDKADVLRFDDLTIDPNSWQVLFGDEAVDLTLTEFNLLYCLASNYDRALTYKQIKICVWGDEYRGDETIRSHITKIRNKLSTVTGRKYIHNKRSVGYYFSK